jgi:hypothetical protein
MLGSRRYALLLGATLAVVGCDPNVGRDEPVEATRPIFDPIAGQIPLPNDALIDPTTGLLSVPVDDAVDSDLTKHVKGNLSRINGWIPGSMITIPFDGELDPATLTGDAVRLYDVTGASQSPPTFVRVAPASYFVAFNVGRAPATQSPYTLYVRMKPTPLMPPDYEMGHRYMVVVTSDVKDTSGRPVVGTVAMELLKSRTPLVNEFGRSMTILPDADAAALEMLRQANAPALAVLEAEVDRDSVVAHAGFTIQSNPMPGFNPMVIGQELPKPIGEPSAANSKFGKPWVCFHHPIDPQTVAGNVKLFKRAAGLTEVAASVSVGNVVSPDDATKVLCEQAVVLDAGTLEASTTYQVVLTDGIKGLDGAPSRQSSIFSLMASPTPLFDASTTPPTLNSPFIDSTFDALMTTGKDPATATQEEWDKAYVTLMGDLALGTVEKWRADYQPFLSDAAAAVGVERASITVTWVFTTAAP